MLTLPNHHQHLPFAVIFAGSLSLAALAAAAGPAVRITKVEPTGSFEKARPGEPRQQIVRLTVENSGAALEASARIRLWGAAEHEEPLGRLAAGTGTVNIHVPELSQSSELTIVLYQNGESKPIAIEEMPWPPQPQAKADAACATYAPRAPGRHRHRLSGIMHRAQ
jgi:hypothetical protein